MSAKKYFKFDELNQFLNDEIDINYYATNQVRRVAVGNMLGDFNDQGIYVLDKDLIKELVEMPKVIVDSVGGADLIRSAIKFDSYIHFMLTIDEDKASLILLEKVNYESNVKYNAGSYSNMNEYVLEQLNIPDKDVDKNVVYTKFNISREDEGRYYEYNDLTQEELQPFENIVKKIKYNLLVQNKMLEKEKEIETVEADYFDNILGAFSGYEDIKKQFEKILKELIISKQNFLIINKPFFAKTINELLDNCLGVFLSKLTPEQREVIENKVREAKAKYYQAYNQLVHMLFLENQNVVLQESDNMIGNLSNSKTEETPKVTRYEVDEKELEKSFYAILEENEKLKKARTLENSGEEIMRLDNPTLSKFFDEIKKEFGVDLLKNKEQVIKKVEQLIKKEVEKEEKKEESKEKKEEKKAEIKKEDKKPEKKAETAPKAETVKKVTSSTVKTETPKTSAVKPAKTAPITTATNSTKTNLIKKATSTTGLDYDTTSSVPKEAAPITKNTSGSAFSLDIDMLGL